MKIIGKDGKVFGKLNVIDFILILLLVAVLAFVGFRALKSAADDTTEVIALSEPDFRFEVVCLGLTPELAESMVQEITADDVTALLDNPRQIFNSGAFYDAQITEAEIIEDISDESLAGVRFTIEGAIDKTDTVFSIASQELRVGKSYIVKTPVIEITGTIAAMENLDG